MTLFAVPDHEPGRSGVHVAWAKFDPTCTYRYSLGREWAPITGRPGALLAWVMLNPSTADADVLDPTLRRCRAFSRRFGYAGMVILNLFGLRSPDPRRLAGHHDAVGPDNDDEITTWLSRPAVGAVVCAWGAHREAHDSGRADTVLRIVNDSGKPTYVLGLTKDGHPKHPLYLPSETPLTEW